MSVQAGSGAEQREVDERDVSVANFVVEKEPYYAKVFEKIQRGELPRWSMNIWGLLVSWLWAAYRGVWLMFWIALAIDILALVCLMQVVKFSPLLAEAMQDPEANSTLIPRLFRLDQYLWLGRMYPADWWAALDRQSGKPLVLQPI